MTRQAKNALIIGSGIAGPVLAMALQRIDIAATVYEAHDAPADDTGWFLNLASNGLDVLNTLGINLSEVDGVPMPRLVMWNGQGKRLGEVANGLRLPDGTVSLCVKREVLQRVLHDEATRRGGATVYGKRLHSYRVLETGRVCATFADGSTAEGDLLVGADGVRSRVRELIDPDAPHPVHTGLLSIGGYTSAQAVPLAPTPDTQHFVFGQRAFFGYLVCPSGEIYWFANLQADEPVRRVLRSFSPQSWRDRLCDLFADDQPFIRDVIAASYALGAHAVYDLPHVPRWHLGAVGIIGDAAHATSPSAGQGASLALEDALVLAKCLRDLPSPEKALSAFEALRRARTERVVAYSRRNGSGKALRQPLARWFRDRTLPLVFKLFANPKALEWLYTYHIDWDERATVLR